MSAKLSVLMITKNAAETLEKSLASIKKIADEIIIVDSLSTDRTVEIAKNYLAKIYVKEFTDIGKQRIFGLSKAKGKWVLILDCDEIVSEKLMNEIKSKIENNRIKINGYYIPYQNFFLGKPLQFGGEDYKMYRHGLVHLYQPRTLKLNGNKRLLWFFYRGKRFDKKITVGTDLGKIIFFNVKHLKIIINGPSKKRYYLPICVDSLYEDFENAVQSYRNKLENTKTLQVKWRTTVNAICKPR